MSSFFDSASLVQIPSGYSDGTLYSVKPIDGTGDLTFSRGSDIEATRVAANGYIEKAKVNLLLQSNSFSSWSANTGITETSGQSGYDGSSDAWKIDLTAAGGRVQEANSQSGVQTYSVYAKAGTLDFILLFCSSGTNINAYFDLSSGTYAGSTTGSIIDAKIESVGGGWYRCSLTHSEAITSVRIYPATAYNDLTATSGNIYIQDAQMNYGLVAQEYQETTTTSVVAGITNDLPRLDYSGGASCPSLLLEPSRQNLLTNDTYYGGSDWSKIGVSPSANNATSPEGVTNAVLLSETAINDQHSLYPTVSVTSGNAYTASCFVKQGTGSAAPQYIGFRFRGGGFTDAGGLVVDLVNKVATYEGGSLTGYKIEDYGNGWLRVSITQSATVTSSSAGLVLFFNNNISGSYSTDYLGNVNADMLVYGMQIEQASYSSSLIPTYGTSATRTSDSAYRTGISSLIGQTEGTLYLEFSTQPEGARFSRISISDGSNNNWIFLSKDGPEYRAYVRASNSVAYSNTSEDILDSSVVKMAIAYKSGEIAYYFNGTLRSSSSSFSFDATLDRLIIGNTNTVSDVQEAIKINQLLLFPTRLSNADLATLTTL
jgi:hypothetical protein